MTTVPAPVPAPRDRIGDWYLLILSVVVLVLALKMDVRSQTQVLIPGTQKALPELCGFRRMTGWDCPGCGMTRAFISMAHGDIESAWHYNPSSIYFFILVLLQPPFRTLQLWRVFRGRAPIYLGNWGYVPLIVLVILVLGQWVVRLLQPFVLG